MKLLICPFCGSGSLSYTKHHHRSVSVACGCGAEGPDRPNKTIASKAWNERAGWTPPFSFHKSRGDDKVKP